PRALEHDAGRVEALPQLAPAHPAGREGILGEALEDLDVLTADRALVLVGRHVGSVSGDARARRRGRRVAPKGYTPAPRSGGAMTKVRKAVIPAAGLGTRFLPATKAQPKEMLPLLDKPAIQYVVEEAVRAGLTDIIIIIGRGKHAIVDHFDRSFELEHFLEAKGKFDELKEVREISDMASIHYIRQRDPLGLGRAGAAAEDPVGDEAFAVLLGDDLIVEHTRLLQEMLGVHEKYGRSVLGAMEVSRDEISLYGCIEPELVETEHLARVRSIVEKPAPEEAPSNLAAIGRYVLTPEIFDCLRRTQPGVGGELQLTDAINLLPQEQAVYAYVFEGGRFDVGNKLDYLKATIELAIDREDIGQDFRDWLPHLLERKKLI